MRASSISPTPQTSQNHQQLQQQFMQISQPQPILMRQNRPSPPGKAPTTPERLTEQWNSPPNISTIYGSYSSLPQNDKSTYPKLTQQQQQPQQLQQQQALQIIPVQFAPRQNNFARQDKQIISQNQNNESSNLCNFCHIFSRSLEPLPPPPPLPAPSSFGNSRSISPQQPQQQQQLYYWIKEPKSLKAPFQTIANHPRPSSLTQYSSTQTQDNNYPDVERSQIINQNYTSRPSSLTHQHPSAIQQLKCQTVPLNNNNSYIQPFPVPYIQSTSLSFPQNTQQQPAQPEQQKLLASNQSTILKNSQGEFNQVQNKTSNYLKLNIPRPSVTLENQAKILSPEYSISQLSPSASPRSLPRSPTSLKTTATTSAGFVFSHLQIPQETAYPPRQIPISQETALSLAKPPQTISEYSHQNEESSNFRTLQEFTDNSFPLRTIPFPSQSSPHSQFQSKRKINEPPMFSQQNQPSTNIFCQENQQKLSTSGNSFLSVNYAPKPSITTPSTIKNHLSSSPDHSVSRDTSPLSSQRHSLHPPQFSQVISKPFSSPTKKIIEQFKTPFQQQQSFEIPSSSPRSSQSTIKDLQPYQSLSESKNITLASKQQPQLNNILPIKSIKWNTSFRQSTLSSQSSRQQSSYPASSESFYIASLTKIEAEEPKVQELAPQISQNQHENHRKNNYSFGRQSGIYQKPQLITARFIESAESSPETTATGSSSPQDLSRNLYPNNNSQIIARKSIPFTLESENSNKGSPKIDPFTSNKSSLGRFSNPLPVMFSGTEGAEESIRQQQIRKSIGKQLFTDSETKISRQLFPQDQHKNIINATNRSTSIPQTANQQVLNEIDNFKDDDDDDDDDFDDDLENFCDNFARHQFEYSFKQSINGDSSIPTMSILDEASKRTKKEYNFTINIPVTLDSIREEDSSRIGTLNHISDPFKSASSPLYQQQQQFKGQIAYPLNPESQSIINCSKSHADQICNQSGRILKTSQNTFQPSSFSRSNNDDMQGKHAFNQHGSPFQYRISSQQHKQISNINNINNSYYTPNQLEL